MKTPQEIAADKHWQWVDGLWESLPPDFLFGLATTEYLYKTAFIHGYKHGQADERNENLPK